ncbi:MAG: phosphate ABC transporter substrate-binding protein [Anaerolineales bacterium]
MKNCLRWMLLMLAVALLSACESSAPATPPSSVDDDLSGQITFAGSTTVQPLAAKVGERFNEHYPNVELEIAAGGSEVGIKAVQDGAVDIGMASRALTPEEAEGITVHKFAVDVLAVVVNGEMTIDGLTMGELRAIYLGEITTWSAVGGPDQPIVVVMRGENSGTRGAFDKIVLDKQAPTAPNLETAVTAGDVAALVLDEPYAIGYVGFGNIESDLKTLTIDGAAPSKETVRDGSYQLMRPLQFLTGPLTRPLGQTFIDFALGEEGQQVVIENGWAPGG